MSSIDQYKFTCLGVIECPTPYRVFINQEFVQPILIAIYHLEQDVPIGETDFQAKTGDILVGGGSGEVPAMRIKIPEAITLYTDIDNFVGDLPVYQAYWSMTFGYKIMAGFETLGWNPEENLVEVWLLEHVLNFLLTEFPDTFVQYAGAESLEQDGSICRLMTDEENSVFNWKKFKYPHLWSQT